MPYHNPHSLRSMLVRHVMACHPNVEMFTAWSQNIGHSDPLTTITSYGRIPTHRQGELIRAHSERATTAAVDDRALRDALATIAARLGT
jgi:hypothetical protein